MSLYKTIRQQLGLSQHELARLLGTNRSQLSYAEAGTRTVGPQGAMTLAALVPAWQTALNTATVAAAPSPMALEAARRQAELCHIKLYPLRKEAAAMRSKYEQAAALQHTVTALQQHPTLTPKQQNWCAILLDKAALTIRQNHPDKQWLLQLQIAALDAELKLYADAMAAATH